MRLQTIARAMRASEAGFRRSSVDFPSETEAEDRVSGAGVLVWMWERVCTSLFWRNGQNLPHPFCSEAGVPSYSRGAEENVTRASF